jgi:hypothetical protein
MSVEPIALERAKSLHRYAFSQGAGVTDFRLCLSNAEGMELIRWLAEEHDFDDEDMEVDIEAAKRRGDPWPVLNQFSLLGLRMLPKALLS